MGQVKQLKSTQVLFPPSAAKQGVFSVPLRLCDGGKVLLKTQEHWIRNKSQRGNSSKPTCSSCVAGLKNGRSGEGGDDADYLEHHTSLSHPPF
eukprot:scaffold3410_cov141-Cylindrotheca_fusiformis.AAC.13